MNRPTGFIIYQGPSELDGAPIVAIALTGKSTNKKTGAMVQTYIMRADVAPLDALASGDDASVCGDCKHRPILGGACYVNVAHGPRSVYAAYARGRYPVAGDVAALGAGRAVRLGTYGDPAAVPVAVWQALTSGAALRTGYTHQWRHGDALQGLCMASADSADERQDATARGWRTFRVMLAGESLARGEFACPASEEAGRKTTCEKCGACSGASRGTRQASVAIVAHGAKKGRFATVRARA